jgi:tRNA-specific 2-thiouridylase
MKKILVAMSGGVDSSVAAALLKEEVKPKNFSRIFGRPIPKEFSGFQVAGAYMRLNNFSTDAEKRAKKVAKILNIPFYVFDFKKEFKKEIINYFLKEYKAGRTPNPCVACNEKIKFGLFMKKAMGLGFDFIATGHYARAKEKKENFYLLKGKDRDKDQSYFLYGLLQNQLKRVVFPVGIYTRNEVERLASKFKLPFGRVKKSMEICFVPDDINDFLKKHFGKKSGDIFDIKGKKTGRHEGLVFYTIGQRKGIRLSGGPYFVLTKDLKKNRLIVTKDEDDLLKKEIIVKNVNWISGKAPKLPLKVQVKIRYRSLVAKAVISRDLKSKAYNLKFKIAQRAITQGQSAVFYKNANLLGGGIIC